MRIWNMTKLIYESGQFYFNWHSLKISNFTYAVTPANRVKYLNWLQRTQQFRNQFVEQVVKGCVSTCTKHFHFDYKLVTLSFSYETFPI